MTSQHATPKHLKLFRQHLHLTQEQAADMLEITRATWNRWENGRTEPPPYLLKVLRIIIAAEKARNEGQNCTKH